MRKYRIGFLTGLAAGYVLGTRAGRERYEQIMKAAHSFAEHPSVQQAAGAVQAQASGLVTSTGTKIGDGVREKVPGMKRKDGHNGQAPHDGHGNGKASGSATGHREHPARH